VGEVLPRTFWSRSERSGRFPASALPESQPCPARGRVVRWPATDPGSSALDAPAGLASAMAARRTSWHTLRGHSPEIASVRIENSAVSAKVLPSPDGDIDVDRVQFHGQTSSSDLLGGDDRGPTTDERIVNSVTASGVTQDRTAHAFDRLLRSVSG